jgi:divalent metal cation (Fe/Co/Zn/Cd) transporter
MAIHEAAPEIRAVQTHLEPLAERAPGRVVPQDPGEIERAVLAVTGSRPREIRTLDTPDGLVAHVTLALQGGVSLAEAHDEATAVSERIRAALPGVADVVVHTEP